MIDRTEKKIDTLVNLLVSKLAPADADKVFFFNAIKTHIVLNGMCEDNLFNENVERLVYSLMKGAGLKMAA